MSNLPDEREAAASAKVAAVLDEHAWEYPDSFCNCGYYVAVPSAHKWHLADALAPMLAGWLAEEREAGRREAAGAIDFDTTCLNCARLLEQSHGEWSKGHQAGQRDLAAKVEALIPGFERDYGIQSSPVSRLRALLADALPQEGAEEPSAGAVQ